VAIANGNVIASEDVVQRLVHQLIVNFEEMLGAEPELTNADVFMAAHNFHCAIVFGLERDSDFDEASAGEFRRAAVATFAERMKREPLPAPESETSEE
jgi:hypothetical protein